jgi:hypothetical protein
MKLLMKSSGHECYSFIDDFSGYNQVPIAKEDQGKTTFVSEFKIIHIHSNCLDSRMLQQYFLEIVVKAFQEYIYKTMVVYFDD